MPKQPYLAYAQSPPRLLAGASVIYWGAMTGNSLIGIIVALLIEACNWIQTRWEFDDIHYVRAWHLTVLIAGMTAAVMWLDGMRLREFHSILIWLPLIFLPVELAMRYGNQRAIKASTFSYFARRRNQHDRKLGRKTNNLLVNTGYGYIALTVVAIAIGSAEDTQFFIGMSTILAWALWSHCKRATDVRPLAFTLAIIIACSIGFVSQLAMKQAYEYLMSGKFMGSGNQTNSSESRTNLGHLGEIKQSRAIFWRMTVERGPSPQLVRTATFNRYNNAVWLHEYKNQTGARYDKSDDYYRENRLAGKTDIRPIIPQPLPKGFEVNKKANLRFRGEVSAEQAENPIPSPSQTYAIGDLSKLGLATSIERNSLGTIRIVNPDYTIVDYTSWDNSELVVESPPNDAFDLEVPEAERAGVEQVVRQLGLLDMPDNQKVIALRKYFNTQFTYTRHLDTPKLGWGEEGMYITNFLLDSKRGHCEYFATATAMILRSAGVPTRYSVGFSCRENRPGTNQWLLRGTHAHAWNRAYIDGRWVDVDLTPPSWMETGNSNWLWLGRIQDGWKELREDFHLWRTSPENTGKLSRWVSLAAVIVFSWIGWRLYHARKSSKQLDSHITSYWSEEVPLTAINQLEPMASKIIGPRPLGQDLTQWLQKLTEHGINDQTLAEASKLHQQARFDPNGLPTENQQPLVKLAAELKSQLAKLPKQSS
ncbi:transglutaminase-like domain-containing protein [Persicirhabdus sediminis]|uniref:Transglutaminase domain-containing protein n=1 Tax=Persicirhabdus sediminis TaxID=454144 RepID=A0A8J7SH37_9BACT|nr:transglutaminase-like domain-containing protein [Persicirhabdus sediminis]MBK1789611.1 transglutaminase domain-containing protein [Persicirhabdus sediminis]